MCDAIIDYSWVELWRQVAAARTALPRVVDIMAQELAWEDQRVVDEIKVCRGKGRHSWLLACEDLAR